MALVEELYPLCRSLTGDGVRETLARLSRVAPLTVHEVPTGTPAFDWRVPKEWNPHEAWIKGPDGAFLPRNEVEQKWLCNLPMLAETRLRAAGVAAVQHGGVCTYSDKRYFSFRRDGTTGRFATMAWLADQPQGS